MSENDDETRPVVEWTPITCPKCGSVRRKDVKRPAGRRITLHLCLDCGQRFTAIRQTTFRDRVHREWSQRYRPPRVGDKENGSNSCPDA